MNRILFILMLCIPFFGFGEEEKKPEPELKEELIETHGVVHIDGNRLSYTAHTGTMVLKDEEGKNKASVFYIAYTKNMEKDKSERPITFCFNGGPGSSAIWLHIGVLGPRRVMISDDGEIPPPYRFTDNHYSILDQTDLVFIDPVSTGYSRAAPGEDPKQFHSVNEDIKWVAEFIRMYTTKNNRWGSPKFVMGESYGTTRAAGLAKHLHDEHMMYLNGVMLVSSVLNFQTIIDSDGGNDLPYILYLPTYTATAWYHNKLPLELQKLPLQNVLKEAEGFAITQYAQALMEGDSIRDETKDRIKRQLAKYTGLSPEYIERSNLRPNIFCFTKELCRHENRTVGRFDSRFKGIDHNHNGERIEKDPSADIIMGGFAAAFHYYVHSELEWKKDEPYKVFGNVFPWNYDRAQNSFLNVSHDLRTAMTRNPHLHLFVGSGYYDLATPYFATNYTINHLGIDSTLKDHIQMEYYEAGHMMYTHKPSLEKLRRDLIRFIEKALPTQTS